MKKGFGWLVLLVLSVPAFAQEADDMYFTAKDRAKLKADRERVEMERKKSKDVEEESGNYSSRNVNPDYIPGMEDQGGDSSYFVPNYQPNNVNPALPNNNCWNCYGGGNFYSPFYYRTNPWNSFYGNFYDPFWGPSYGMMSPFNSFYGYNPGWSFGMGWNSFYGPSFSLGFGTGWGWGSPYSSWNNFGFYDPFYNPYAFGYGYYGGWGRPIIVINDNNNLGRDVVYQKRRDRSSSLSNDLSTNRPINMTTRNGRVINGTSSGRQSGDALDTDRTWRRSNGTSGQSRSGNSATRSTRSYWENNNNSGTRPSRSWGNDSGNSTWDNGNSSPRNNSWSPGNSGSRSWSGGDSGSSWSGGNSGSRSSGTSGGGGSRSSSGGRGRP